MGVCKECRFEGEFKFCPQCGAKYEVTVEDRLSWLEQSVSEIKDLLKRKVKKEVVVMPQKEVKKRTSPMSAEQKLKAIYKYVKEHPTERHTIGSFWKKLGIVMGGRSYPKLKHLMDTKPHRGIKVTKTKSRTYLQAKAGLKRKGNFGFHRERASWIGKRGVELMKQGFSRKKAWKRASEEYSARGKKGVFIKRKPLVPHTADEQRIVAAVQAIHQEEKYRFPKIEGVQRKYKPVLIDILKKIVKEGTELRLMDASVLEIRRGKDYLDFMASLAFHQNEIASYLGVENKFTFVGGGDERVLKYGG